MECNPESTNCPHLEASAERDAREAARRAQAMRTLSDDGAAGNVGASTHKQQRTGFDPLPPDGSVPSQARVLLSAVLRVPDCLPALTS